MTGVIYTMRGLAYADSGDLDDALKDYTAAIEINPMVDAAYFLRGEIFANRGEWSKAQGDFDRAIALSSGGQNVSLALAHQAWLFATWPDAPKRDGAKAITLALRAIKLRDRAANHDVLAAAYAETGQFDGAVREETNAMNRLQREKDRKALPDYEARLALYQKNMPYRAEVPFPKTSGGDVG